MLFKWKIDQVQIICNFLKSTVPTSDTGCAFTVMLGEDELYGLSSGNPYFRAVCVYNHAFCNNIVTGGDKAVFAFQFNNTDTTGCDFIDPFQITKLWDRNTIIVVPEGTEIF